MKIFTLILCVLIFGPTVRPQTPSSSLAITNVTVIDITGAPPRAGLTVVINSNRIKTIGKAGYVRIPRDAQIVDGRGKYLIPGLWDMHVHFTEVERSFPMFIAMVTGVRNMGGDLDQLLLAGRCTGR